MPHRPLDWLRRLPTLVPRHVYFAQQSNTAEDMNDSDAPIVVDTHRGVYAVAERTAVQRVSHLVSFSQLPTRR